MTRSVTSMDRALAKVCEFCPVCRTARRTQSGGIYDFVRYAEAKFCPFCKAYGRVHCRPAHAPLPHH